MSNKLKLLLLALALLAVAIRCCWVGHTLLLILGVVFGLIGALLLVVWVMVLTGRAVEPLHDPRRLCPHCGTRHYIAYPRGTKFGFAFPAQFVRRQITDYNCQNCGLKWTVKETSEYDSEP